MLTTEVASYATTYSTGPSVHSTIHAAADNKESQESSKEGGCAPAITQRDSLHWSVIVQPFLPPESHQCYATSTPIGNAWRPESNTYLTDFRRVSRGLLPAGCLEFATAVAKFRGHSTTGYGDIPPGIRVLDIGSGDGVVVPCWYASLRWVCAWLAVLALRCKAHVVITKVRGSWIVPCAHKLCIIFDMVVTRVP